MYWLRVVWIRSSGDSVRCTDSIIDLQRAYGSLKRHEIYKQKFLCLFQSFLQTLCPYFYIFIISPFHVHQSDVS